MKSVSKWALVATMIVGMSGAAFATSNIDDTVFPADGPCTASLDKYCRDLPYGKGEKAKCLNANYDKLDKSCKAVVDQKKKDAEAKAKDTKKS